MLTSFVFDMLTKFPRNFCGGGKCTKFGMRRHIDYAFQRSQNSRSSDLRSSFSHALKAHNSKGGLWRVSIKTQCVRRTQLPIPPAPLPLPSADDLVKDGGVL